MIPFRDRLQPVLTDPRPRRWRAASAGPPTSGAERRALRGAGDRDRHRDRREPTVGRAGAHRSSPPRASSPCESTCSVTGVPADRPAGTASGQVRALHRVDRELDRRGARDGEPVHPDLVVAVRREDELRTRPPCPGRRRHDLIRGEVAVAVLVENEKRSTSFSGHRCYGQPRAGVGHRDRLLDRAVDGSSGSSWAQPRRSTSGWLSPNASADGPRSIPE